MSGDWVVLLEHTTGAAHVLKSFRELDLKVVFVGKNPEIAKVAHKFFEADLIRGLDAFLGRHLQEIQALHPIAVIGFMENTKQAEKVISTRLNLLKNDQRAFDIFRDKVFFREFCRDSGIPSVDFAFVRDSEKNVRAPILFPFIIKPNFGYASGGVRLVRDEDQFQAALKGIRRLNRFVFQNESKIETGAICEEFLEGVEHSVDSITVEGRTRSFLACLRGFPDKENFCDFTYFSPCENQDSLLKNAEETLNHLFKSAGYRQGPSHSEFRWSERRKQHILLEVGARVGFVGNIGRLCERTTGIPYNTLAIRSMIGRLSLQEMLSVKPLFQKFGLSLTPDTKTGGRIKAIRGEKQIAKNPSIVNHYFTKSVGDIVVPYPRGIEYLGEILLIDKTRENFDRNVDWLLREFGFEFEPV